MLEDACNNVPPTESEYQRKVFIGIEVFEATEAVGIPGQETVLVAVGVAGGVAIEINKDGEVVQPPATRFAV